MVLSDFERWKQRYEKHWCTKEQLQRLVELQVLTPEQYTEITGEEISDESK